MPGIGRPVSESRRGGGDGLLAGRKRQEMCILAPSTVGQVPYSCLQNPWRELPRSDYPIKFWLQRRVIGDQSDISNIGVINCVESFLNRLEIKLFKRRYLVDI